jgi:hypothetical protein
VRETYRLYLRKYIRDEAARLGFTVLKRFEEIVKDADFMTTMRIASAVTSLAARGESPHESKSDSTGLAARV